jgi:hypothetical protein
VREKKGQLEEERTADRGGKLVDLGCWQTRRKSYLAISRDRAGVFHS